MQQSLPLDQKYMLTLKEAAAYFGIGHKKMSLLASLNEGNYTMRNGNRYLICRPAFEKYLEILMYMSGGVILLPAETRFQLMK